MVEEVAQAEVVPVEAAVQEVAPAEKLQQPEKLQPQIKLSIHLP